MIEMGASGVGYCSSVADASDDLTFCSALRVNVGVHHVMSVDAEPFDGMSWYSGCSKSAHRGMNRR